MACGEPFSSGRNKNDVIKYVRIAIPIVVLAVVAVFVVLYLTSPQAAVRRIMDGYRNNDPDAVIESYPEFFMDSVLVDREKWINDIRFSVKVSSQHIHYYELEDPQKPSASERERLMKDFKLYGGFDFDESDIKDIRIIWVNYDVDFGGVLPQAGLRFVMIKYEGRWCWWPDIVERY